MSNMRELETKMRRSEQILESELSIAMDHLQSASIHDRVIAYELILYAGNGAERENMTPMIERECAQTLESKGSYPPTMLFVLRRIPWPTVCSSSVFRNFIISAARDGAIGSRINSVALLEKLVMAGDQTAMDVLTSSLSDEDSYVRF